MTSDPALSRRVTRLENDTESIDELTTDVRSTLDVHSQRFDRFEDNLTEFATDVRSTLDEHAQRFDRIDSTLAEVVRRLPGPS